MAGRHAGETLFIAAIGAVLGIQFVMAWPYPPDAKLFPMIVAGAGILLCLAMLLGLGRGEVAKSKHAVATRVLAGVMAAPPAYAVALYLLGFWVATLVTVPAMAWALGYRRPLVLALTTIGLALAIGLLFPLVNVGLPKAALF